MCLWDFLGSHCNQLKSHCIDPERESNRDGDRKRVVDTGVECELGKYLQGGAIYLNTHLACFSLDFFSV